MVKIDSTPLEASKCDKNADYNLFGIPIDSLYFSDGTNHKNRRFQRAES